MGSLGKIHKTDKISFFEQLEYKFENARIRCEFDIKARTLHLKEQLELAEKTQLQTLASSYQEVVTNLRGLGGELGACGADIDEIPDCDIEFAPNLQQEGDLTNLLGVVCHNNIFPEDLTLELITDLQNLKVGSSILLSVTSSKSALKGIILKRITATITDGDNVPTHFQKKVVSPNKMLVRFKAEKEGLFMTSIKLYGRHIMNSPIVNLPVLENPEDSFSNVGVWFSKNADPSTNSSCRGEDSYAKRSFIPKQNHVVKVDIAPHSARSPNLPDIVEEEIEENKEHREPEPTNLLTKFPEATENDQEAANYFLKINNLSRSIVAANPENQDFAIGQPVRALSEDNVWLSGVIESYVCQSNLYIVKFDADGCLAGVAPGFIKDLNAVIVRDQDEPAAGASGWDNYHSSWEYNREADVDGARALNPETGSGLWGEGDLGVGQWEEDKVWYNVRVLKVLNNFQLEVLFTDFGNTSIISEMNIVMTSDDIPEHSYVDRHVGISHTKQFLIMDDETKGVWKSASVVKSEEDTEILRLNVGDHVFAKWTVDDVWYNGKIVNHHKRGMWTVQFSDYGNEDTVAVENIVQNFNEIPSDNCIDEHVLLKMGADNKSVDRIEKAEVPIKVEVTSSGDAGAEATSPLPTLPTLPTLSSVPPSLRCCVCKEVARRARMLSCNPGLIACWGCAVRTINSNPAHRCWVCGRTNVASSTHLVKDEQIREAVDRFTKTGEIVQVESEYKQDIVEKTPGGDLASGENVVEEDVVFDVSSFLTNEKEMKVLEVTETLRIGVKDPVGMCKLSDGSIIVCSSSEGVLRFDNCGILMDHLTVGENRKFNSPSDVIACTDGEVVIADKRGLHLFDSSLKFVKSLAADYIDECHGVTEDNAGNIVTINQNPSDKKRKITAPKGSSIFFIDKSADTLQKIIPLEDLTEAALNERRSAIKNQEVEFLASQFSHITFKKGMLYITDLGLDYIFLINTEDLFDARMFGGRGKDPGLFRDPTSVAADEAGNFVVVDSRNHRLQIFNRDHQFIGEVKTEKGVFCRPTKLFLDADTRELFVSNKIHKTVIRFKVGK